MTADPKQQLLLVEDEQAVRVPIAEYFRRRGYAVLEAPTAEHARELVRSSAIDAVLLDHNLPDGDGLEVLLEIRKADATLPVIILTAHGTIDLAVKAIKEGADQFLTKPAELKTLLLLVERLTEGRRQRQVNLAQKARSSRTEVDPFVGDSPAIRSLSEKARRLAAVSSPVLILGETGCGKGVLADWIHSHGPRAMEAFVDLNCAGLSREFLETELFGHERGAFTGAQSAKQGLFEVAHRGTLFLDEIGDVDLEVQPKLLKVVEEQRFRRLGSVRDRQVDVRLVAATHHSLEERVQSGRFRSDLYYRISTLPLVVPPLRDRGRDVLLLARIILRNVARDFGRRGLELERSTEDALLAYDWPGNIRELRNVLERAALLSDHDVLSGADLRHSTSLDGPSRRRSDDASLEQAERAHVERVVAESHGDVSLAAERLGLSRSGLYKKIKRLGVRLPGSRTTPG